MLKVNNGNIRTRWEICSKLVIKATDDDPGVFISNFEDISNLFLVFLLLNLNKKIFWDGPKRNSQISVRYMDIHLPSRQLHVKS